MPILASKVTVTTAPVLIASGEVMNPSVTIANASATDVFLGGSGVDATNGFPLGSGSFSVDLQPSDLLYAMSVSNTTTVNVIKTRV